MPFIELCVTVIIFVAGMLWGNYLGDVENFKQCVLNKTTKLANKTTITCEVIKNDSTK